MGPKRAFIGRIGLPSKVTATMPCGYCPHSRSLNLSVRYQFKQICWTAIRSLTWFHDVDSRQAQRLRGRLLRMGGEQDASLLGHSITSIRKENCSTGIYWWYTSVHPLVCVREEIWSGRTWQSAQEWIKKLRPGLVVIAREHIKIEGKDRGELSNRWRMESLEEQAWRFSCASLSRKIIYSSPDYSTSSHPYRKIHKIRSGREMISRVHFLKREDTMSGSIPQKIRGNLPWAHPCSEWQSSAHHFFNILSLFNQNPFFPPFFSLSIRLSSQLCS